MIKNQSSTICMNKIKLSSVLNITDLWFQTIQKQLKLYLLDSNV